MIANQHQGNRDHLDLAGEHRTGPDNRTRHN